MQICDMTRQEMLELIGSGALGRLACCQNGQPFIAPLFFALESGFLYAFSTLGQKIRWMRENPLVCVEFERLGNSQRWATVVVNGRFEELPDTPEFHEAQTRAHYLLQKRAAWWQPGYAKTLLRGVERPLQPLYFRIQITSMSGRQSIPEQNSFAPAPSGLMRVIARLREYLQ